MQATTNDITITAAATSPPACHLTWAGSHLTLDCADVRTLAAAMNDAAARAEAEAAVVATLHDLGAENALVGPLLRDLRIHYAEHGFGIKHTLTFVPGVSLFDGRPFAHANVTGHEPQRLDPATLRGMARQWIEIAEAAERDAILLYALAEATDLDHTQVEAVFHVMRNVRPEGRHDDQEPQ